MFLSLSEKFNKNTSDEDFKKYYFITQALYKAGYVKPMGSYGTDLTSVLTRSSHSQ